MQTFRVLVVEDDEFDAEVVSRALKSSRQLEYEIEHVSTLSNAFDRVFRNVYDIILLDLGLPDGFQLNGLSKLVTMLDVPIIVLTGNEDPELAEQAIACGAHDYVPKSENLNLILHRTVQFAIQRHAARVALTRTEEMLAVQNQFTKLQAGRIQEKLTIASRRAAFAENTQQCVAILASNSDVEWANEAFESHCNVTIGKRRNVPLSECFPGCSEHEWLLVVREAVRDVRACRQSWTDTVGDGELQWTRVEVTPMGEKSGGVQRFVFSFIQEICSGRRDTGDSTSNSHIKFSETIVV